MTGTGDGLGGAGIVVLDGVGSAIIVEDNEVSGATDASLIVERTSAEVTIQRNQFTNTVVAEEVGGGEVFGYGVLVLDSEGDQPSEQHHPPPPHRRGALRPHPVGRVHPARRPRG